MLEAAYFMFSHTPVHNRQFFLDQFNFKTKWFLASWVQ